MSTQKNEHNPSRLTPDKVGEGFRLLRSDERVQPGDEWWVNENTGWLEVGGRNMGVEASECLTVAIRRRITPPTDTTGSGREGETPEYCPICTYPTKEIPGDSVCRCKGIQTWALSCYPGEVAFVKTHPNNSAPSFYRRDDADKRIDQLERQRDAALAQVEALRRDGERLASQCSDMRESLNEIANNSNYKSGGKFFYLSRLLEFAAQASAAVVADASFEDTARLEFVIQFIQKHGLKGLGDAIVEIYNASDVREFGREAIDKLRAAIDSAQRQEGR